MSELFYMGGPLFIGILTLILIVILTIAAISFYRIRTGRTYNLLLVKEAGILGLITGVLGQFLGLYSAFSMIEISGTVSPELLMGGLKVSSITPIYGLIICLVGYLLYYGLRAFTLNPDEAFDD